MPSERATPPAIASSTPRSDSESSRAPQAPGRSRSCSAIARSCSCTNAPSAPPSSGFSGLPMGLPKPPAEPSAMNAYLGIPLCAAIACFAFASVILLMGVRQQPNRLAAALMLGGGFWAACEVLWNSASDPQLALWLKRISAPGWALSGALGFHLVVSLATGELGTLRRLVPVL